MGLHAVPSVVLRGHHADVQALDFDRGEGVLISGDAQGEVRVWRLDDCRPHAVHRLHPVGAGILHLRLWHPGPNNTPRLITQGRDGITHVWQLDKGWELRDGHLPIRTFSRESYSFCRFSLLEGSSLGNHPCRDGNEGSSPALLAIPGNSGKEIDVCCLCCGATIVRIQPAHEAVDSPNPYGMAMAVKLFASPLHQAFAAVGYESGHVIVYDLTMDRNNITAEIVAIKKLHLEPVMALDMDRSGSGGISGSAEDKLVSFLIDFDAKTIKEVATIDLKKQGVADVSLRQDGKLVASAGWDGKLRVYKRPGGKALAVLKYHSEALAAVAFGPSTGVIASGARDGTIALWDVYASNKVGGRLQVVPGSDTV